ncbi:cysteine desulfurase [Clostridia bacterium]|nr:cysteine desulfurase [Clostridia bacterium]
MKPFIYLDNSATTRVLPSVIDTIARVMRETDWNPSALYHPAIEAERIVSNCRETLRSRLDADRVIFTSGGTEADNLGILGVAERLRKPGVFLLSAAEHAAVLEQRAALESHGHTVKIIPLTREGLVDLDALHTLITLEVTLIAIMEVCNETGTVQPLSNIIKMRDAANPAALLFVDGVQGFLRSAGHHGIVGRGADLYSLSAHKIHGPKGVGALALSKRVRLNPRTYGGGQESGLRSGTENVTGIAGLHAAIDAFDHCGFDITSTLRAKKLRLINALLESIPGLQINGPDPADTDSAPHIVNFSPPGIGGEVLVHALEFEGVYVGTGSACSSKKHTRSQGFQSMGITQDRADRAVRVSLSPWTTVEELDIAANAIIKAYQAIYPYRKR